MISFISRGISTSFRIAASGFNSLCSRVSALYLRFFSRNSDDLSEALNTHQREIRAALTGDQQKAARLGRKVDKHLAQAERKTNGDLEETLSGIEGKCAKIESATAGFTTSLENQAVEKLISSYKRPDLASLAAKFPKLPLFKPE